MRRLACGFVLLVLGLCASPSAQASPPAPSTHEQSFEPVEIELRQDLRESVGIRFECGVRELCRYCVGGFEFDRHPWRLAPWQPPLELRGEYLPLDEVGGSWPSGN